jgi:hypothetical protein
MINDIIRCNFLHKFFTMYLDDICVYSRTLEEDLEHMRLVLQRFKEEGLKMRLKKYHSGLQEMEYLGAPMPYGNIYVSTKKVEAAADSLVPTKLRRFEVSCSSATSTPIILATLRLH